MRCARGAAACGYDYRTNAFSCPQYGSETYSPSIKEEGMQDYRLDAIEQPERHLIAVDRLTGRRRSVAGDRSSGELPGHKVDGRR